MLRVTAVGHHSPPSTIAPDGTVTIAVETDGATVTQTEVHPVEIFTEPWPGGADVPAATVGDVLARLLSAELHDDAIVRVAVPVAAETYHRCLDVDLIGFGRESDAAGEPVVEITTERWDSMAPVIRQDAKE